MADPNPPHEALKNSIRALVETSVHNTRPGGFFSQLKQNVDQIRTTHYSPTKERAVRSQERAPSPVRRNDKQLLVAKIERQNRAVERLETTVHRLQEDIALLQDENELLRTENTALRQAQENLRLNEWKQLHEQRDKERKQEDRELEERERQEREQQEREPKQKMKDHGHGDSVVAKYKTALSISRHQCDDLKRRLEASTAANRFQQRVLEQLQGNPDLYPGEREDGVDQEANLALEVDLDLDLDLERLLDWDNMHGLHQDPPDNLYNLNLDSTTRLLNGDRDGTTAMLLRGHLYDPYDMFRHHLGPGAKLRAVVIALRFIARMRALVAHKHAWRQQVEV